MIGSGLDATNSVEIPRHLALDIFLKFDEARSDNRANGDEKSEPGSGVSGQMFREEHPHQALFAGSEDDASRAQQASGSDRGQFKAEAKPVGPATAAAMPALAGSHFNRTGDI